MLQKVEVFIRYRAQAYYQSAHEMSLVDTCLLFRVPRHPQLEGPQVPAGTGVQIDV